MNYKKGLIVISIIICIFLMISNVSAVNDIGTDGNQTSIDDENQVTIEDIQEDSGSDEVLSLNDGEDILAESTIYFNAAAPFDGDGSQAKPYKYYDTDKIPFGATVYFAAGVYDIESTLSISSSLNYKTTFIGQNSQNTIFRSSNSIMGFKVRDNSNFVIKDITFDGVRINNNGNIEATNAVFKNTNSRYSTIYSISSSVTPTLKLTNCVFENNYASDLGGSISFYTGQIDITNCVFQNSKSNSFGGAVELRNGNLNIINSRFDSTEAQHAGAVYGIETNIVIRGSTFNNCKSEIFGGVVACDYSKLIVDTCNFTNSKSLTDGGGAIYSVNGNSEISNSLFINDYAYFGGAICNLENNMNIDSCEFINNYALYYGGSIYNMYSNVNLTNSNITKSRAGIGGGAILTRFSHSFNINSNMFVETFAPHGPVVFFDGDGDVITLNDDVYRDIYQIVAVYTGYINGEEIKVTSNYLTYSVSNYGHYLIPEIDNSIQNSPYVDFNIYEGDSSLINTNLTQDNLIFFNLVKKNPNLINRNIEIYLMDEVGNNVSLKTLNLNDTNYLNEFLYDEIFRNNFLSLEHANFYSDHIASEVPILNYISQSYSGSLPYSYDSRDYGYITPVKDQASGGNCWAFGGLATLEATLKKATGITFDFSEENVKNIMAEFSQFGWNGGANNGGNDHMLWAYLASWFGPIYEEYDYYDEYSALSVLYDTALHIQNIYEISNTNINEIKNAVMNYGAVTMTTNWNSGEDHCMSIVGWDDNFHAYDYFGSYATGAWIVKNSYGPNWGDNGYLYISFNRNIRDVYTFVFSSEDRGYSDIYQYDYGGLSGYWYVAGCTYKNKFVSRGNDILSAVSTYFEASTPYTVKVYLNGTLIRTQTGDGIRGYNVIPLVEEVQLSTGDEFDIEFTCQNSKIPYCKATYNNKETFNRGLSFYYTSGGNQVDLYDMGMMVACIKAFTRPASLEEIEISINPFSLVQINTQISINVALPNDANGWVTFTIDGVNYYARAKDGRASLLISFNSLGTKTLVAQYKSNLEQSNIVTFNFKVQTDEVPSNIVASINNVTKYYGGPEKYTAVFTDNGLPCTGKTVTVGVDGKTYTATTDSYGQISFDFNLNPGTYTVRTFCDSKIFSSKFTVKSTIGATDYSGEFKNCNVNATFSDSNGNPIRGKNVIFKVNGIEFVGTTDYNGSATVKMLQLDSGEYTVTIINPITGEQVEKRLLIGRATPKFEISSYQDGSIISIYADIPIDATGYVTLKCEDKNAFTPIINENKVYVDNKGYTLLKINDLGVGNHTVTAYYEGDDNYKGYLQEYNLTVSVSNVVITAEDFTFYYGGDNKRYYVAVENNGQPVMRPVAITIDGWTDLVSANDGNPYTNVKVKKPGIYPVLIEYGGVNVTRTINVKPTIVSNDTLTYDYLNSKVFATFLDKNGEYLKNQQVTFKIGDREYSATTDNNGFMTKDVILNAGNYDVTILTPISNEEFKSTLKINKITPTLNYNLRENPDSYAFTSILSQSAIGGSFIYTFEGKAYNNGLSDFIMHTSRAGIHNLAVRFTGDTNLNPVSATYSLDLKNKADIIYASDVTAGYRQGSVVPITVLMANGMPKANSKVTLVVNGAVKYVTTDSSGRASYLIDLDAGTYDVKLTTDNNGYKNIRIVVNKATPKLTASKKTFKLKVKTKKYKVTFNLPNYKLSGYKLTLKVKGKTYKAYTNAKGQATFKINKLKKKGTFKAVIKFSGDGNLNKVSKTVKIKVK